MSQIEERVMAFPVSELPGLPDAGFLADPGYFDRLQDRGFVMYPRRSLVESNPAYKHVIVYMLVWFVDDEGGRRYLTYQRGSKGEGEDRLESMWSLGIGGHVNSGDVSLFAAARREFMEELPGQIGYASYPWWFIGAINDNTNHVGSVHLGALWSIRLRCTPSQYEMARWPLRNPSLRTADEIGRDLSGKLESWSEIVFRQVIQANVTLDG